MTVPLGDPEIDRTAIHQITADIEVARPELLIVVACLGDATELISRRE